MSSYLGTLVSFIYFQMFSYLFQNCVQQLCAVVASLLFAGQFGCFTYYLRVLKPSQTCYETIFTDEVPH